MFLTNRWSWAVLLTMILPITSASAESTVASVPQLFVRSVDVGFPGIEADSELGRALHAILPYDEYVALADLVSLCEAIEKVYLENGLGVVHVYIDVAYLSASSLHIRVMVQQLPQKRRAVEFLRNPRRTLERDPVSRDVIVRKVRLMKGLLS